MRPAEGAGGAAGWAGAGPVAAKVMGPERCRRRAAEGGCLCRGPASSARRPRLRMGSSAPGEAERGERVCRWTRPCPDAAGALWDRARSLPALGESAAVA